ncbi:MAG: MoxR family ATPase [Actinomycetia bacterium]|nr:MoxR family ATPase [Actinomycetes bacterium]MCP4083885.1 MoxR family ATPase [Actinomycetes bacterium]
MTSRTPSPLPINEAAQLSRAVIDRVSEVLIGRTEVLELVLCGVLANGHILLEDMPGLGKTLTVRTMAAACGLEMGRVQFTPDLMPADVTGSTVWDPANRRVEFRPGPLFTNLLLGDEINRAPPKTQAALLEAMQERQVTIDGETHPLPQPFMVIATQNPIEFEGTYPLPEAQLDRFLLRTSVGTPTAEDEVEMVRRRIERRIDNPTVEPVIDLDTVRRLQQTVEDVLLSEPLIEYVVALVRSTRTSSKTYSGASPRGVEAVVKLARARALLAGRDYVTPDDVKAVAGPALGHRIIVRPELWVRGTSGDEVVADSLATVPTPTTLPSETTPPGS